MPLTSFLEDLTDALFNPRDLAVVYNVEKRGLGTALATVLIMGLLVGMGMTTPLMQTIQTIQPVRWIGIEALIAGSLAGITMLSFFVLWILYGLLLYVGARLAGGKGDLTTTLAVVGTCFIGLWPLAVLPPLATILGGGFGSYMGSMFIGFPLGLLWMHYGIIQGLSEVHGISSARTVLAVIISFLIGIAVPLLIIALM